MLRYIKNIKIYIKMTMPSLRQNNDDVINSSNELVVTESSNFIEYGQRVISVFGCQGKPVHMATKMISYISVFMAYKAPIRWRSFVAMDNELP